MTEITTDFQQKSLQ